MAYPHTHNICCHYPNAIAMDTDDCMVIINKSASGATEPLLAISLVNLPPALANALRMDIEQHGGA